jgi:aspartate kinase
MGHTTDELIALAKQITDRPPAREMDMLLSTGEQVSVALVAMAIHSLGHEAISMTGAQLGIVTDSTHTKARIRSISTERLRKALEAGNIVIAAGFQGTDDAMNITTLGRGGSDTTAVALAAALKADACEIYTDVDGVYTTDPRLVPEARKTNRISYDEMLELASAGAGVMHNRSIEFAKKFDVPVHVRSSLSDTPGTMIVAEPEAPNQAVCGAAVIKDEARVTLRNVPDRPGVAAQIFMQLAAKKIGMDMIVQNVGAQGLADISFTVDRDELPVTLSLVGELAGQLGAEVSHADDVAKLSVVGLGMATQPGVAEKMFRALAEKGINIEMITTSEIKISVLVAREFAQEALRTVHEGFGLSAAPAGAAQPGDAAGACCRPNHTAELMGRLERMEDLIIDDVQLDESQARVTLVDVPDIPGLAAQSFDEIAEAGIVVDMIVQSVGREGHANISFTVAHADLGRSLKKAKELATLLGCPPPTHSPKVAKLSVFGIGMKSHTDVAARMFRALSAAGINVEMISTSEVRINVVVQGDHGPKALDALRQEFADAMV